ncbi:MAG: hypothetical protein ACSHYA_15120 [Opitutaceae bacterium]
MNAVGKRVYCYQPSLEEDMEKVVLELLGPIYTDEARDQVLATRTGNAADHMCLKCAKTFKLDPKRDQLECPKCHHSEVAEAFEMGGKSCPKCQGTLSEGAMGGIS